MPRFPRSFRNDTSWKLHMEREADETSAEHDVASLRKDLVSSRLLAPCLLMHALLASVLQSSSAWMLIRTDRVGTLNLPGFFA